MDMAAARTQHRQLKDPKSSLGALNAFDTAKLITAASDVTLILDNDGLIRDAAFAADLVGEPQTHDWIGRRWPDIVSSDSKTKVEELLRDAAAKTDLRWRHVNHVAAGAAADLPIRYCALQVGQKGRIVALGRDLRAIAKLQQRLYDAQLSLEREYSRLRLSDTRYRLMFEVISDAVLIVDAGTLKIVEANPAALRLINRTTRRTIGRSFLDLFDAGSAPVVNGLIAAVRVAGRADEAIALLADRAGEAAISATLFRQEALSHILVRLTPTRRDNAAEALPKTKSTLLRMVEKLPDGFVVTGSDWRIMSANPAFLDMANLASEDQARAESLERFVGRDGVAFNVLTSHLREHGLVRNFATTLNGDSGTSEEIEITAVSAPDEDQACYGFTFRPVRGRLVQPPQAGGSGPRSVEQLTELVGRVSLKDIVRESTDIIEQLAIKAALQLTGDNRASAADMLGMSRQSLYVKLRRHSLGDLDPEY
ncbi:transcriptional regulator PpsR [Methylocella silvestris]|uniref:Transcriptional regulator PpsR n=1 Tax=Methylocella silvestris TaxID=199596 RepID=A0A2J7TDD5_METSI|nr:transcriptional regulator PpsR [Methylocella silvestris]